MVSHPLDEYLKDLYQDMEYAIKEENCVVNVTTKDLVKLKKVINRSKRQKALLARQEEVNRLFERKFIDYRNKLASMYTLIEDESIRADIKHFLEIEQGDVQFADE